MEENSVAKVLSTLAGIVLVVGIIGSLILGKLMPAVDYSSRHLETHYNWALAIGGSAASIITCVLFTGFAEVINLLQRILSNRQITDLLQRIEKNEATVALLEKIAENQKQTIQNGAPTTIAGEDTPKK